MHTKSHSSIFIQNLTSESGRLNRNLPKDHNMINPPAVIPARKLLQAAEAVNFDQGATVFTTQNGSTTAVPSPSTISLDSSKTLTILIVITVIAFIVIYSVYIRCFSESSSPPSAAANTDAATSSSPSNHHADPSDQKKGSDSSTVKSLIPFLTYDKAATPPLLEDCPICLIEFGDTECVKMIPYCGHVFHPLCVDMWLESHASCPLCRSTQLLSVAEEA